MSCGFTPIVPQAFSPFLNVLVAPYRPNLEMNTRVNVSSAAIPLMMWCTRWPDARFTLVRFRRAGIRVEDLCLPRANATKSWSIIQGYFGLVTKQHDPDIAQVVHSVSHTSLVLSCACGVRTLCNSQFRAPLALTFSFGIVTSVCFERYDTVASHPVFSVRFFNSDAYCI
uniref:Uncharacterized protein n=1 Tax=Hyaloperonospora arabidopsidis (strain Emoy2) TaxID=559515 RepID=M4BE29_HYAAE